MDVHRQPLGYKSVKHTTKSDIRMGSTNTCWQQTNPLGSCTRVYSINTWCRINWCAICRIATEAT